MLKEYENLDAVAIAELIKAGDVSQTEVMEAAITRAEERNPALNAIIAPLFEDARSLAKTEAEGPLAGVPFLIKDIAYLKDVPCTYGSRLWQNFVPDHDAELIARFKKAGLNIFGKTNTPEVGLACTTEPVLFGPTHNPWNLEHTPGGSSGGAAAAVAAGILPAAHATDGGGSIRIPASCCGLVGLKPTRGRTSLGPDIGEGWGSMSTAHVVSRSVRDSAALLDVTHGPAVGDPYHAPYFGGRYLDEVKNPDHPLRIAVDRIPVNDRQMDPEVAEGLDNVARLCESLGHNVEERSFEYDREALGNATSALVIANVRNNVNARAEMLGIEPSLDVIEQYTHLMVTLGEQITGEIYAASINCIHRVTRQLEIFFLDYDLILSPTLLTPPPKLGYMDTDSPDFDTYGEHFNSFWGFTNLYNATGNPAISLPLHWSADNLPVGIQFVAPWGGEDRLFNIAAQMEEALPWFDRRP